jgi:hypothetical protein
VGASSGGGSVSDFRPVAGFELEMAAYAETIAEEIEALTVARSVDAGCWGEDAAYFGELLKCRESFRAFPPIVPTAWE